MALYLQKTKQHVRFQFLCSADLSSAQAALDGLRLCLREEYGDTYIDRKVYDRAWLENEAAAGRLVCALAQTDAGEPAACLCLKESPPFYGVGDLSMHVVRTGFRGFGLGTTLVHWLMARPEATRFTAIGSHNATFHVLSQKESYAGGLRPCGILFSLYRSEGFVHSHANVGRKLSYAVAVRPQGVSEAALCPPEAHRDFLLDYYHQVGTAVRLLAAEGPADVSRLEVLDDMVHNSLLVSVTRCGADLGEQVAWLLEERASRPLQTATVCLDLTDTAAPWGCEQLCALGFFFAGVQPFCQRRHYLLLHHPMGVEIPFDEMLVAPEYEGLFRYVQAQCLKRQVVR